MTGDVPLGGPPDGRCLVIGVVTVTPDLFSDVGKAFRPERAIGHGMDLLGLGTDLIEVGGESARPGATPVPLAEERRRVIPVVRALAEAGAFVCVATVRARIAEAAVEAGARMVTDPSGGLADPAMLPMLAGSPVPYAVTYWWGHPGHHGTGARPAAGTARPAAGTARPAAGTPVVSEVLAGLAGRVAAAATAGIALERLLVDPGLGLARTGEDNWQLLAHLGTFRQLGRPVLTGSLRASFPGRALPGSAGTTGRRPGAGAAIAVLAAAAGAWGVRTHDAAAAVDAVRVVTAVGDRSRPAPVHVE